MNNIKVCIFDMDGLIFDTESLYLSIFPEIVSTYGHSLKREQIIQTLGMNSKLCRAFYEDLFPSISFSELEDKFENAVMQISGEGKLPFMKGAKEILAYLKEKDVKLALASSSNRYKIIKLLKDSNIYEYFDYIISGNEVTHGKPNPEIFNKAIEYFGVEPENVYIFEDSYNGIRAAHKTGAKPIMIPDILPANEEMRELSYRIFDNLLDAITYIERNK